MTQVTGTFKTVRDGGIVYTYEAIWNRIENSAVWTAKVRRDGTLVGVPGGTILNVEGLNIESVVRSLVEASIENKIEVQ